MQSWWNKKVEDLSKGMQQKVQFVATVLHDPELIILDEPFSGFDPVNAELIKEEILELNKNGATIIFSTHRMESVEELCDSIALINRSHKILDGKVKDIRNSYRTNTYKIDYEGNLQDEVLNGYEILKQQPGEEFNSITVKLPQEMSANVILKDLLPTVEVKSLTEVIPTINEIFIQKVTQLN